MVGLLTVWCCSGGRCRCCYSRGPTAPPARRSSPRSVPPASPGRSDSLQSPGDSRRHWDTGTGGHSPGRTGPHRTPPGTAVRQCNVMLLMWCNNAKNSSRLWWIQRNYLPEVMSVSNINNLYKQAGEREGRGGNKNGRNKCVGCRGQWIVRLKLSLAESLSLRTRDPLYPGGHSHSPVLWWQEAEL